MKKKISYYISLPVRYIALFHVENCKNVQEAINKVKTKEQNSDVTPVSLDISKYMWSKAKIKKAVDS